MSSGAPNARMGGRAAVRQANPQAPGSPPAKGGGLANWSLPMIGDAAGEWRDPADVTVYVTYAEEPIDAGANAWDGLGVADAPGAIDVDLGGAAALQTRQPIQVPRVGLAQHFAAPIGIVKALASEIAAQFGAEFNLDCAIIPGSPETRWDNRVTIILASDGVTPAFSPWIRIPDFCTRVKAGTIGGSAEIMFGDALQTEIGATFARFAVTDAPLTPPSNAVFVRLGQLNTFSQFAILDFEVFS